MPKRRNRIQRDLRPVLHIYCEGEKTEPNYLNCYLGRYFPGNRRLRVIRVEKTPKTTPVQLVDEAISAKNDRECPQGDVFWVVYDREGKAKYPDTLHRTALDRAKSSNVKIALSNVCFEIWILLHFEETSTAFSSYDDLRRNSNLRKKYLKGYEKGDRKALEGIVKNVDKAVANAKAMNRATRAAADPSWTNPYQLNPYTDVYKLIEAIKKFMR